MSGPVERAPGLDGAPRLEIALDRRSHQMEARDPVRQISLQQGDQSSRSKSYGLVGRIGDGTTSILPVADPGASKCRHVVVQVQCRLAEHGRKRRTTALSEPHAQIEQRPLPHGCQGAGMARFSRDVGKKAMVDGAGIYGVRDGSGGGRHKAIDDNRDVVMPGGDQGAQHGGDLAAAEAGEDRMAFCLPQALTVINPDGIGVLWAARLRGIRLPERVAGSDLVPRLAEEAAKRGWRLFFLGAAPGVAEQAADVLERSHPGLSVAGCYAGSPAPEEEATIVDRIQCAQTDLLLVAYGAPKQDLWLARNLARTGAAVGIGVGGSFDFIAGTSRRAPRWVQRLGLEWLHRLVREPWRWRRQLALPLFAWLVLVGRDRPTDSLS